MYSSHILFEEGLIREFIEEDTYDTIIKNAIEQHNKYKVEEGFSEEEFFYIHMIRDADKLDHFRVKDVEKDIVLLGVTYEEAGKESITDEVYQQFCKHQLNLCSHKKNTFRHVDFLILLLYLIFILMKVNHILKKITILKEALIK